MWRRIRVALGVGRADGGFEEPLWRALAVFRMAALIQVVLLLLYNRRRYAHPIAAVVTVFVLAAWSVYTIYGYGHAKRRVWPLLVADIVIIGACVLASVPIEGRDAFRQGAQALTASAIAGPAVACAIRGGRRLGVATALVMGACDVFVRGRISQNTVSGTVLLVLACVTPAYGVSHASKTGGACGPLCSHLSTASTSGAMFARDLGNARLLV